MLTQLWRIVTLQSATWLVRAPVSGGVGDVGIKLPIRVAPRRQGLGTALYQLLLAEVCLFPWPKSLRGLGPDLLPVELCTVGRVRETPNYSIRIPEQT